MTSFPAPTCFSRSFAVIFVGKCETLAAHMSAASSEQNKEVRLITYDDALQETAMIGQSCRKVAVIDKNCKAH